MEGFYDVREKNGEGWGLCKVLKGDVGKVKFL